MYPASASEHVSFGNCCERRTDFSDHGPRSASSSLFMYNTCRHAYIHAANPVVYTHTHISYRLHVCMSNKPALTIFHLFRHFSLHVSQSRLMCSVRRAEETGLSSKSAPRVRVREPSCSLRGNPALASSLWQSSFRSEATTFHSDYFPSLHPELPYLECSFTSKCKF